MLSCDRTLRFYESYNRNDAQSDMRRGEEDGRRNEPPSGDKVYTGYVANIVARCENDLSSYNDEWQRSVQIIANQKDELTAQYDSYAGKRDNLLNERRDAERQLSDLIGPTSNIYMHAEEGLKDSESQLKSIRHAESGRPLQAYMTRNAYLFTFLILFISEMPINIPAISVIFQDSYLISGMVAASLSMVMVYFAHTLGRLLRQPAIFKGGRWLYYVLLIALITLSAGIVICVYLLRQEFLLISQSGKTATSVSEAGWLFLFVNAAVFSSGVLVSVFHHDPNPDYQRLAYQCRDLSRIFQKIVNKYYEQASALQAEYDEKQRRMNLDFKNLELELKEKKSRIESHYHQRQHKIERVLGVLGDRIAAYQDGNKVTRTAPLPESFGAERISQVKSEIRKRYVGDIV